MLGCEGADGGKAPETEVGEEQIIGQEYQRVSGGHNGDGQHDGLPQLASAELDAALGKIQAVLLAVAVVSHDHEQDHEQAAEQRPHADVPGGGLIPEGRAGLGAPLVDGGIEDHAHNSAEGETAPVPGFALALGSGQRLCVAVCLELGKVAGVHKSDGGVDHEHEEAYKTQGVEEGLPLPGLVIGVQLHGGVKGFVEEGDAVCHNVLGEVGPGVGDGRVEDHADGFLAVHFLGVIGLSAALFQAGGVNAEVQEGLGSGLVQIIPGSGLAAVLVLYAVEEFVILAGDDTGVAGAEDVDPLVVNLVNCVVGDQQSRCDQALLIHHDCGAAGQSAVGVAGDADAGGVHKGQAGDILDRVIKAVGVVLGFPPGACLNDLGIAVAVHADGDHNITPAGIFHIVQILHFPVVVPAVAAHDGRSGIFSGGVFGYQQQCVQLVAAVGDQGHVVVLNAAAVRLDKGCTDRTDQADDQCNGYPEAGA